MCKGETSTHALGSPERGAVAARSGVTEGLVQRGCGRTSVTRQLTPGGRGSPPLRRVGSGRGAATSVHRRRHEKGARAVPAGSNTCGGGRHRACRIKRGCNRPRQTSATGQPRQTRNAKPGAEMDWRVEPALSIGRRRRTGDGAPYDASCSVQQQTHVVRHPTEGASGTPPPTVVARCRFQRSREVQFITPVALYAARPVSHTPVRGGVPDAPRSCDRRAALGADVWLDRQHPRFPRCAILASTTPRMRSRGHSPRTIFYGSTNVTRQPTPGGRRGNGSERNRRYSSAGAGEISGPTRAVALIFSVSGRRRRLRRSGARRLRGRSSRRRCAVSRRRRI